MENAEFAEILVATLINSICERGGTDFDLHRVIEPGNHYLVKEIARLLIRDRLQHGIYTMPVDYEKSLEVMLGEGDYYKWDKQILIAGFKAKGSGKINVNLELLPVDQGISWNDNIDKVGEKGYRAANHIECLSFGARHTTMYMQWESPIVALGSAGRITNLGQVFIRLDSADNPYSHDVRINRLRTCSLVMGTQIPSRWCRLLVVKK